jgi:hypothetical protein
MKNMKGRVWRCLAVALLLRCCGASTEAQVTQTGPAWNYTLLPDSLMVDSCPVCGRPDILVPIHGTFQLRLIEENPLFSTYAWEGISWAGGSFNNPTYKIVGQGTYQLGGEVAVLQDLSLQVYIDNGVTNNLCYFTNAVSPVVRLWPMIQISLDQTNGTALQQFHLDLSAAPVRELWLSTRQDFHAGIWQPSTNRVSAGDLISSAGRVVKRNQDLTGRLGIEPVVPDLGLKDVEVLPGGEIAFSIETDMWSESLGTTLQHGDLLSDRGRIIRTNQDLIAAFAPVPPVPDMGLDAVQVMDNGEVYFSVQTNFFSETLGRLIRRGDLLSSSGQVLKTNEELIGRFRPGLPKQDYGLAAVYIWPSGETWFSTEDGFYGSHFEHYAPGDLLSDQGYVVYSNTNLLSAFAPVESVADFGLDALFIVTDVAPLSPAAGTTILNLPQPTNQPPGSLVLQWKGGGRVFQLEKATNVAGPYSPISPLTTEAVFVDDGTLMTQPQGFYRLRQW